MHMQLKNNLSNSNITQQFTARMLYTFLAQKENFHKIAKLY